MGLEGVLIAIFSGLAVIIQDKEQLEWYCMCLSKYLCHACFLNMFSNSGILNSPFIVKLKTCHLKFPSLSFSATASVPHCLDALMLSGVNCYT